MPYLIVIFFSMIMNSVYADDSLFEDYPAEHFFQGVPAKVDFKSRPGSKLFFTRLTNGAAKGPNFAGAYTVVGWGCGTNCVSYSVVSAETGKISEFLSSCGAASYQLDSALLIINPPPISYYPRGCTTRYLKWNGTEFEKLELKDLNTVSVEE